MITHIRKLPYINPELIFNQVATSYGTVFLDSCHLHKHYGGYSFIAINPIKTINDKHDLQTELEIFEQYITINEQNLPPFTGGLIGYISYDYGEHFEPVLPKTASTLSKYWFGLYNQVFAFDHEQKICYLIVTEIKSHDSINPSSLLNNLEDIYNRALQISDKTKVNSTNLSSINLKSNFSYSEYINQVKTAINHILEGDIFEVNLSQQFSSNIPPDYNYVSLYNQLRKLNKAPFASFLNIGELKILSASPERFLTKCKNLIEVRPIKGTIRADVNHEIDLQLQKKLLSSVKDRAENIMIVDLMRNDLSKICTPDSVKVTQLCGLESFDSLHHLVSVIEGKLCHNINIYDILRATFPGGSVTGAPKIKAMELIHKLEKHTPREIYCGSIGYIGFNGNIDLSIAIRTIIINHNTLKFNVGGAVTLQSDPVAEYEETLIKAQKIIAALNLGRYP